jgi:uncharacterized protein (TIGR02677 family)
VIVDTRSTAAPSTALLSRSTAYTPSADTERLKVFTYLVAPNAEQYLRVVHLFVAHKRRFGLRLSPRELLARWDGPGFDSPPNADELITMLDQLVEWGAVDRQADTGRAATTAEFKRARNTYDITAAGEEAWEAAQRVLALERHVASLGQQRLARIAETLEALADVLAGETIDGQRADQLLVSLRAEIAETVQGISSFMRELGDVMTLGERLAREPFLAYKTRVVDHLQHFTPVQRACQTRFVTASAKIDARVDALAQAIVATGGHVAAYGDAPHAADTLRAAEVRERWRLAYDWLVGSGDTTPWDQLRRTINGAVDWLLDTWGRLASEQTGRLDRSADYRRLAAMLVEDPEAGPELFHLAFALTPCRHLSVVDLDEDQLEGVAGRSWWEVAGLDMDRTLRLPSARSNQGRTPRLPDTSHARQLARTAASAERAATADLRAQLLTLHDRKLAELGEIGDPTLAAIDEWLMECGAQARSSSDPGPWHHFDAERELTVALTPTGNRARLQTTDGAWELADFHVEVVEA